MLNVFMLQEEMRSVLQKVECLISKHRHTVLVKHTDLKKHRY